MKGARQLGGLCYVPTVQVYQLSREKNMSVSLFVDQYLKRAADILDDTFSWFKVLHINLVVHT